MKTIEEKAIETYNNNLIYLEQNNKKLYDKIKLFELGIELNEIEEEYILEYKENNYFDLYNIKNKEFLYNCNSNNYSKQIVNSLSTNAKENSFRTFYSLSYEEGFAKTAIKASITSNAIIGTAPIIDYVNQNLPKEENLKVIYNYIIFGVSLGLHIPLIHKKMKAKIYTIIEPSLEVFRLSLFVTDFSSLGKTSTLIFHVSESANDFSTKFSTLYYQTFFYNHYLKFCMFSKNCDIYVQSIQSILVSQTHYLYTYDKELLSLKRTYEYINKGFRYIDISKKHRFDIFKDKPVLFLAAGPSLKHEVDFIKNNRSKFVIVAVYATITLLEEHDIVPDIVVQFDQGDASIKTLHLLKNKDFLSNTIFLFASHVTEQFTEELNNENIFMFQPTYPSKVNFGTLAAPSVGEIAYFLILQLGFKTLYMIGLDMALDPKTKQAHFSKNYRGTFSTDDLSDSLEKFDLRKNLIKVKGNFLDEIDTLSAYKISIDHVNFFTKMHLTKDLKIYNLSNGAYFENTKPLKTNNIKTDNLKKLNKLKLKSSIQNTLLSISEDSFNEEDIEFNKRKIKDAKKIKEKLENFNDIKISSLKELKDMIFILQDELCTNNACKDIQTIMNNYFNRTVNYIFYFFNLKEVENPKRHIKKIQKVFLLQNIKIINKYINMIEEELNTKEE